MQQTNSLRKHTNRITVQNLTAYTNSYEVQLYFAKRFWKKIEEFQTNENAISIRFNKRIDIRLTSIKVPCELKIGKYDKIGNLYNDRIESTIGSEEQLKKHISDVKNSNEQILLKHMEHVQCQEQE